MVLRFGGWPLRASVAACLAAGVLSAQASDATLDPVVTGATVYKWGGPVPPPPRPGEHAVYVPSIGLGGAAPVPPQPDFVPVPYVAGVEPPQ